MQSFGGAITSFGGSNISILQSDVSDNIAGSYAGGVLALNGLIYATQTKFNRNQCAPTLLPLGAQLPAAPQRSDPTELLHRALFGGGATKALAGVLVLDQCELNDNSANSGAAIEIARQGAIAGGDAVPTIVFVKNSVIARNRVINLGAAFNMASCQQVVFQNVQFVNNSGTALAGRPAGAGMGPPLPAGARTLGALFGSAQWSKPCRAERGSWLLPGRRRPHLAGPQHLHVLLPGACACARWPARAGQVAQLARRAPGAQGNSANLGGALFTDTLCNATLAGVEFSGNLAKQYGGAVLAGDEALLRVSLSSFTNNGNSPCFAPPLVRPFWPPRGTGLAGGPAREAEPVGPCV